MVVVGPAIPAAQAAPLRDISFTASVPGEAVALVHATCASCDWGVRGREAVALRLALDGQYSQHLILARGAEEPDYPVLLGPVTAGTHRLTIDVDDRLSRAAPDALGAVAAEVEVLGADDPEYAALARTPILHARPDTIGRCSDLPVLAWYEVLPTPRGRRFKYSFVFTNEDGGTPADRLMATWGRTTDIEYVYAVEVDGAGAVIEEHIQAEHHTEPAFTGRREGGHPLLWVSTTNNMVGESGTTSVRYRPRPERLDLTDRVREVIMDRHPWTWRVMAGELQREDKIAAGAAPGSATIPDVRGFTFVDACTDAATVAMSLGVAVPDGRGGTRWIDSDRGVPGFRIGRAGCVRVAIPTGEAATPVTAVRFHAYATTETPAGVERVHVTRINGVFGLDAHYLPRPVTCGWSGSLEVKVGGSAERACN
jgi:hypothetical protein